MAAIDVGVVFGVFGFSEQKKKRAGAFEAVPRFVLNLFKTRTGLEPAPGSVCDCG